MQKVRRLLIEGLRYCKAHPLEAVYQQWEREAKGLLTLGAGASFDSKPWPHSPYSEACMFELLPRLTVYPASADLPRSEREVVLRDGALGLMVCVACNFPMSFVLDRGQHFRRFHHRFDPDQLADI